MKKYQRLFRELLKTKLAIPTNQSKFTYCGINIESLTKEELLVVTYKLIEDDGFIVVE